MTIRPISDVISSLEELIKDPITQKALTSAMTFSPCGHTVNQEDHLVEPNQCGLCEAHQTNQKSVPNLVIQEIAKNILQLHKRKKRELEDHYLDSHLTQDQQVAILTRIKDLTKDPVFKDNLIGAVTLFPCGHNINEDVAQKSMQKHQLCPLDKQKITHYVSNKTLQKIVQLLQNFHHEGEQKHFFLEYPDLAQKTLENLSIDELKRIPKYVFEEQFKKIKNTEHSYGVLCRNFARRLDPKEQGRIHDRLHSRIEIGQTAIFSNPNDFRNHRYLAEIIEEENTSFPNAVLINPIQFYIRAIQLNPSDGKSYIQLAKLLPTQREIVIGDTVFKDPKQLYTRGIKFDGCSPQECIAFAQTLQTDEKILDEGIIWMQKDFYHKALEMNSDFMQAYFYLGNVLPKEEYRVLNSEVLSKKECYIRAIRLGIDGEGLLNALIALLPLVEDTEELFLPEIETKQQLCIKIITLSPQLAIGYTSLASLLEEDKNVVIEGHSYFVKDLYLKAIEKGEKSAPIYHKLACLLGKKSCIIQGKKYHAKDLCCKSLEIDPNHAPSYFLLSNLIAGKIINLNGQDYDQKKLLLKTIELNPYDYNAWLSLGNLMTKDEKIQISSNFTLGKKEVLIYFIEMTKQVNIDHLTLSQIYYECALLMNSTEEITLLNKKLNKKDFYCKSIELYPYSSHVYQGLMKILKKSEKVEIVVRGKNRQLKIQEIHHLLTSVKTVEESIKEIIKEEENLDKDTNYNGLNLKENYYILATQIQNDEWIKIKDDQLMTKRDLYLECIQLDANDYRSYFGLGALLDDQETILLLNDQELSKKELYQQGISLCPHTFKDYYEIAQMLPSREEVKLHQNTKYFSSISKKNLYYQAVCLETIHADVYCYLADELESEDLTPLHIGKKDYLKSALYEESIKLKPSQSNPYFSLSMKLNSGQLNQKRQKKLFVDAILHEKKKNLPDPDILIDSYFHIADLLEKMSSTIKIKNSTLSKQELYSKILSIDPKHKRACEKILACNDEKIKITLNNGLIMTREQLQKIVNS